MIDLVWLIPVFPLVGFLINGLFGRRFPEKAIGWIGAGAIGASFVVALSIFFQLIGMDPGSRSVQKVVYTWMASGDLSVPIGFLVDPLSMVMLMVVTGVGLHHPRVLHRVHAWRARIPPIFLLSESLRVQHAHPGGREQFPAHVRGVGRGRPVLVSPDRVLLRKEICIRRWQESIRREPDRGLRVSHRNVPDIHYVQDVQLHRSLCGGEVPILRRVAWS